MLVVAQMRCCGHDRVVDVVGPDDRRERPGSR